ncbi:hypothetical protein AUEXF2481DRAFT_226298 [Aureobasidium subglaciale EXF-2481]|uniref:N-acetyltransferase domain-containing protein n=1 Tax=Aureobasidium subglaciale (strain EXF-2481) TaxID=1043005 RepID=A0A074YAV2_AURSE|nr:uncharacterized protein AUEXF2481DRAFT_226298 [Aureobasidium subglaciale EXF-2481]KEQ94900.1 hypothetical protein AUEXF2481DRAFT_226298 [Aureobasidium subglaciale EXF-2481]
MTWKISEATLADVPAITSIYSHDEPTPFIKLCLGSLNVLALNFNQAARIANSLQDPEEAWFVARDERNKIASFAEWQMPKDEADTEAQMAEELAQAQEAYGDSIAPGMNSSLVVEFRHRVTKLRNDVLRGQRHYLLMNIGTAKTWQQRGAAMALVKRAFDAADREKVAIYLDTVSEGPARRLFDKLGFEEVGSFDIDLSNHGGQGLHSHVGVIRWPLARI